jgi:hypothetical protein
MPTFGKSDIDPAKAEALRKLLPRNTRVRARSSWDYTKWPGISDTRCGARTRKRTSCQRRTYPNGRCRNHGCLCTGLKTEADRRRIAEAQQRRWKLWRLQRRDSL